jgi:acetoin utilization deacetylase AcuC-like enzyme
VQVDPDTSMNPFTAIAALRAAGAVVLATDLVLAGDTPSAFCCVRPPGHHAEREAAMGFCFFNNVAVGIRHATDFHGLQRVALIDFDVHHGNGSQDIFRGDSRVLMCSTFETDIYPFAVDVAGDNMVNIGLPARSGGTAFRDAVTTHWLPALERFAPELVYISAGFDGHRDDDMGNIGLVDADYTWVTRQILDVAQRHCKGRIVSTLEGGYRPDCLARSVAAHVAVLIGAY